MILITDSGVPIDIQTTQAGGRILRTLRDGKLYRKYTHPSRVNGEKRLQRDVLDIELAVSGQRRKAVKVRRV